jgi:hypothetical protein
VETASLLASADAVKAANRGLAAVASPLSCNDCEIGYTRVHADNGHRTI